MFIALVFLAHIYVDLIVSATNVLVVFLSTINKHFLLLLLTLTLIGNGDCYYNNSTPAGSPPPLGIPEHTAVSVDKRSMQKQK